MLFLYTNKAFVTQTGAFLIHERFNMKESAKVNILGVVYTIYDEVSVKDDIRITDCDGVTDFTTREILIAEMNSAPNSWKKLDIYKKRTIRHEIVHAVLFESGLDHNTEWARNEEVVDWIAIQFPKLLDIFKDIEVESF